MRSGAVAKTAVGHSLEKGGAAYANPITYRRLYGDNYCEKQQPRTDWCGAAVISTQMSFDG